MSAKSAWRRCGLVAAALLGALGALHALPQPAGAATVFIKGFQENLYQSPDPAVRARWLDETVEANANIVRVPVFWSHLVGPNPPVDPRNPADPAYDFAELDAIVRDVASRGLRILFTVSSTPRWAEGPDRPNWAPSGTWKPDPEAFGAFGEALARRYSGSYVADASGALPRVDYFEAWNEANQNAYLSPQWENRRPVAPNHYRKMLNAFYDAVHAANPSAKVMGPATLPFGDPGRTENRMRPLLFLRHLLCLKDRKGRSASNCGEPAHLDIVSHHPINLDGSHRDSSLHPDDVVIGDMDELKQTIRFAERARTILPRGRHPIWVSELWWLTRPAHPEGVPERKQASYIQGSFYELWRQGIKALIWFQLADDRDFQSGLFGFNDKPKPGLTAFRFPFVTRPAAGKRTLCWGIPPSSGKLEIERKAAGGWRTVERLSVRDTVPFQTRIRTGADLLRASLNGDHSLPSKQRR